MNVTSSQISISYLFFIEKLSESHPIDRNGLLDDYYLQVYSPYFIVAKSFFMIDQKTIVMDI